MEDVSTIEANKKASQLFEIVQYIAKERERIGQPFQDGETLSNYTQATYGQDLMDQYVETQGDAGNYLFVFGTDGLPKTLEYEFEGVHITYPK
jgi:hypothetical protein